MSLSRTPFPPSLLSVGGMGMNVNMNMNMLGVGLSNEWAASARAVAVERAFYLREEQKAAQIRDSMEQCQQVTDKMLGILDAFEDKLRSLESSMLPIHKGTQALNNAHKNLDATISETETIIRHYRVATESEDEIGQHRINAIDYVSYLEWVERIHMSINYFTANKARLQGSGSSGLSGDDGSAHSGGSSLPSAQHVSDCERYLKRLRELNRRAMAECEMEFERVLSSHSKNPLDLSRTGWPLPATMAAPTTNDYGATANGSGGSSGGSGIIPFQLVPVLSVRELSAIATRMAMAGNHTYYGILLTQRSSFLRSTLKKAFHDDLSFLNAKPANANHTLHTHSGTATPNITDGSLSAAAAALATSGAVMTTASNTSLYQKHSHRSVFYLEFFLKLLELEHAFLLQLLSHVFNEQELSENGLQATVTNPDSMLPPSNSRSSMASSSSTSNLLHSLSSSNLGVSQHHHPSSSTGSLTVFWGQAAYDQLYANIIDAPLEYFRKKIDQTTYLKEASMKLSNVFNIGQGKGADTAAVAAVGASVASSSSGVATTLSAQSSVPLGTSLGNKLLILLDVLEQLSTLLPRYRLLLKSHTHFDRILDFQSAVTTLARKSLSEYRQYMVEYSEKTHGGGVGRKVKDGTIYTLTVETLNFIKRLFEYRRVIDATPSLIDKHHHQHQTHTTTSATTTTGASEESEGRARSSSYLEDRLLLASASDSSPMHSLVGFLLSGLESNLESKAKSYKLPALSAVFLLNNFHYASKWIKKNEAAFLASSAGGSSGSGSGSSSSGGSSGGVGSRSPFSSFADRYDQLVHTSMKQYRTVSWEKVVAGLDASEIAELHHAFTTTPISSSAHKTARKSIKHRFASFNAAFEDLYHTQRHFSIPDSDLRSQLRNDNVELIMTSYKLLYNTMCGLDFSTNSAKYTKYTPTVLEAMLNKFFDEEE